MEEYPEELRTPPVSLVALVGCSEHHAAISTYLTSQQPPINALALPDFSKISLLLLPSSKKDSAAGGILKRDWLLKHRTKIPAVVAALFSSHQVSGDPAQWLQVCSDLDALKSLLRPKNIKLLLAVVHSTFDEISEDRLLALRKRAEVDVKHLLIFNPADPNSSVQKLGATLAELAIAYYRDEGRRIKTRIEKKLFNSVDFQIRYCFKVGVYAEFRRDWAEALRFYEDAYHVLREMVATSTRLPPIQRLVEIKVVAEQLHFKISTLLLHGGKVVEAITWYRQHYAAYKKLVGAPQVLFLHWEWMSRQFLVFAELLETSSTMVQSNFSLATSSAEQPVTEWEFLPAYYYQSSASYLREKRSALELALSISDFGDETDNMSDTVAPAVYVGQFVRLLEQGDALSMHSLSDEEFTCYVIAEAKRFQDSFEIIALLKKSYESYSNMKVQRMASICAFQIAREYFSQGDISNAKPLFDGVAKLYRQEGWVTLLWEVLGYLRECSKKKAAVKDLVEYSLEMAALPVSSNAAIKSSKIKEHGPCGSPDISQREMIQKEVFKLICGEAGLTSEKGDDGINVTKDCPLRLEIDVVSPLRSVLLASVAFHEQMMKPGVSSLLTLSLVSHLPLTVEIDELEIQFNQSECNFTIVNSRKCPSTATSWEQQGYRTENAPSLELFTNKWLRLTYEIKSEQSGKLECISVIAKTGPYFTVCCRAESPASMDDLPLWKFEDCVETFPTKDPALAYSGQKVVEVEEPEAQVDITLGASGPALVGESFILPVTIVPRGHTVFSGELKINLVDVSGGGLISPRESESFSVDSHHVELLGITEPEGKDEYQLGIDHKQVQQSFGFLSVPFLDDGESWCCKLEIKWHRPKPVVLFLSLGYSPNGNESKVAKVNVHKSVQIEGRTPVLISHKFMVPFRRDALLLSRIQPTSDPDQLVSLPQNEKAVLAVTAKNQSEVPLQLHSMSIEVDEDDKEKPCSVQDGGQDLLTSSPLMPGEEFKKIFTILPEDGPSSKLKLGSVNLKWRRHSNFNNQSGSTITDAWVSAIHKLPDVNVEKSPLVVSLDCPPYAVIGDPFTYSLRIRNQTELLQEVKLAVTDAQNFVLSGSHSDTVYVLPKSEKILCYKIVALASGSQPLPRVSLTSVRYSAGFQPPTAASTIFVFPSKPHFQIADAKDKELGSAAAANQP